MAFEGKKAVVTGASLGLGRAIAVSLAEQGADVAGFDIRSAENKEMSEEVRSLGRRGVAIRCDISDRSDVRRAVGETMEAFGRIDILVNNAGVFELGPVVGADFDQLADSYERQLGVNARGTFLCTLAVLPVMLKQGGGDVLNVITNHVHRDHYRAEAAEHAYDASKWAQWSLTETMALELKEHGIRVRGLCPAATDTPMLRSLMPEPSPKQLGDHTGIYSLMMPEDVALAAVNMLNWCAEGPVGVSPLVIYREDAERLVKVPMG